MKNKKVIAAVLLVIAFIVLAVFNYRNPKNSLNQLGSNIDIRLGQYNDASVERISSGYKDRYISKSLRTSTKCTIALSIAPRQSSVVAGSKVSYDMTIKNTSSNTCKNVSISNYYSDATVFVSSTPKPTASNYYWYIGTLGAAQEIPIYVEMLHGNKNNNPVVLEACATADNTADSCVKNILAVTSSSTAIGTLIATTTSSVPVVLANNTMLNNKEYGTWVWDSPIQMKKGYADTVFNAAVTNGINVLYVTVDDYLNIYAMPEGVEKDNAKKAYVDAFDSFIKRANAKGLAVDALAGWRDWAEDASRWKADAIVDFVKEYNATKTPFRGFQYDVEPYLLPTYTTDTNKARLLGNFVKLVDDTKNKLQDSTMRFSVVIPHFYDSAQKWTPSFVYGGIDAHAFTHVLRILNTKQDSSIIIMAYRNTAEGDDGSIELSQAEINEASNGNSRTKIIVAQETGNVDPAYVTFFNTSKARYVDQVAAINNTFKNDTSFGGIAVHYIDPFMQLK